VNWEHWRCWCGRRTRQTHHLALGKSIVDGQAREDGRHNALVGEGIAQSPGSNLGRQDAKELVGAPNARNVRERLIRPRARVMVRRVWLNLEVARANELQGVESI